MTKKCLCTISSKNPTTLLLDTVNKVKLFYPEFDIVVIDSDSDDFTNYHLLSDDIKVEYCKNKNWELGAWYYSFNKYTNYDVYMFIQDGLTPTSRINDLDTETYKDNRVYSCHYDAMLWHGGYFEFLQHIYGDSCLHYIAEYGPNYEFIGTAHSSFIANKQNVSEILKAEEVFLEKKIVKTKTHSMLAERFLGLIMSKNEYERIDMSSYFHKTSINRDLSTWYK